MKCVIKIDSNHINDLHFNVYSTKKPGLKNWPEKPRLFRFFKPENLKSPNFRF